RLFPDMVRALVGTKAKKDADGSYFLVNVVGNTLVARLSNRFLGRTVFLDPSMGYAMLIVAILGAAFLFLCLTIRIKIEEKKLTQL
ncbi:hypothetical protein, partial [[Ruminococcus] lactaris]|uniref:hypothetical protein n=1 Tax=[Ruminococcus] lactaris TaxID=46228 RepID=UPI0023AF89F8